MWEETQRVYPTFSFSVDFVGFFVFVLFVARADLHPTMESSVFKLMAILLPQACKCWNDRCESPWLFFICLCVLVLGVEPMSSHTSQGLYNEVHLFMWFWCWCWTQVLTHYSRALQWVPPQTLFCFLTALSDSREWKLRQNRSRTDHGYPAEVPGMGLLLCLSCRCVE